MLTEVLLLTQCSGGREGRGGEVADLWRRLAEDRADLGEDLLLPGDERVKAGGEAGEMQKRLFALEGTGAAGNRRRIEADELVAKAALERGAITPAESGRDFGLEGQPRGRREGRGIPAVNAERRKRRRVWLAAVGGEI